MPKQKPYPYSLPIDIETYRAMHAYCDEYGITIPALVKRMWQLYSAIDQARQTGIFPEPPREKRDSELDAYLDEMQADSEHTDDARH